jgi:Trp operon repressor
MHREMRMIAAGSNMSDGKREDLEKITSILETLVAAEAGHREILSSLMVSVETMVLEVKDLRREVDELKKRGVH